MLSPPIEAGEFARGLDPLGPFEESPRLAVGVSGGADSMALCLLAAGWTAACGGSVVGLTVDHGLRPESAAEARQVGAWLAARGIEHHTLFWDGDKPATGVPAAAREARYRLLTDWCRDAGVLHLLLAHHEDDQAETLLQRLARGSGINGLAAMAPVVELRDVRLLRPLLGMPHARLAATLTALHQGWVEDPTNRDRHYQRARLRETLAREGGDTRRLAETAAHLARARQVLDDAFARAAARIVDFHPAGFARLKADALAALPAELGLRLVSRLCQCIGGTDYPPRFDGVARVHADLAAGRLTRRRTFAGCVLAPGRKAVVVCREIAAVEGDRSCGPDREVLWDGRFRVRTGPDWRGRVGALGRAGWLEIRGLARRFDAPPAVMPTLPALYDQEGLWHVPYIGYWRRDAAHDTFEPEILFQPRRLFLGIGHCLV